MCTNTQLYYAGIDASQLGPVGLKTALHDLIDGHTVLSYTPEVWTALTMLDRSPTDSSRVRLLYSDHTHHATDNRGQMSTWNREHAWPRSYGVSDSGPDNTDVHHIFASDSNVNSARGNKYFDNCPSPACTSPAHPEAAADTATDSDRWQPPASRRGDIARALFYMSVRYDGSDAGTTDLELAEVADAAEYPSQSIARQRSPPR